MATVDGITAAKAQEIEDASIVSGVINPTNGHLILTTAGGVDIDAGQVIDYDALANHIADVSTHGIASAIVGRTEAQTLTNKTLTDPVIGSFVNALHTHNGDTAGGPLAIGRADSPAPITTLSVNNYTDASPGPKTMASLTCPAGRWLILATCEGVTLGSDGHTRFSYDLKASTPALNSKIVSASSDTAVIDGGRSTWGWLDNPASSVITFTLQKNGTGGGIITNSATGSLLAIRMG